MDNENDIFDLDKANENSEEPEALGPVLVGWRTHTLLFRKNLSADSVKKMSEWRRRIVVISSLLEKEGTSRELSLAFTHLEQALHYVIKHFCLVDPQAEVESV